MLATCTPTGEELRSDEVLMRYLRALCGDPPSSFLSLRLLWLSRSSALNVCCSGWVITLLCEGRTAVSDVCDIPIFESWITWICVLPPSQRLLPPSWCWLECRGSKSSPRTRDEPSRFISDRGVNGLDPEASAQCLCLLPFAEFVEFKMLCDESISEGWCAWRGVETSLEDPPNRGERFAPDTAEATGRLLRMRWNKIWVVSLGAGKNTKDKLIKNLGDADSGSCLPMRIRNARR